MEQALNILESKFKTLDNRLTETTENVDNKINRAITTMNAAVSHIKADVSKEVIEHVSSVNTLKEELSTQFRSANIELNTQLDTCRKYMHQCKDHMTRVKSDVEDLLVKNNQELNKRDIVINNTIKSFGQKLDTLHFDIIDNENNISVTYVNPNGKIEYGSVRKLVPDNKTLQITHDNVIALKYNFDKRDFNISSDDTITTQALSLTDGSHITADKINNDLKNATYNIDMLSSKITKILGKLNTINGYVCSNNFKKANPSEEQLYNLVISCLSSTSQQISKELIPNGTKVKNTFDNHIWVLNRVRVDGLTKSKWEDFGSDNICIANNDGVHGLVTGSQEHYMGYIDLQGRISINGLEEDIVQILKSIKNINTDLTEIQSRFSAKLNELDNRLSKLGV